MLIITINFTSQFKEVIITDNEKKHTISLNGFSLIQIIKGDLLLTTNMISFCDFTNNITVERKDDNLVLVRLV